MERSARTCFAIEISVLPEDGLNVVDVDGVRKLHPLEDGGLEVEEPLLGDDGEGAQTDAQLQKFPVEKNAQGSDVQ